VENWDSSMGLEFPDSVERKTIVLSVICWKSGVPIEGGRLSFLNRLLPGFPGGTLKNFG
jgi:hypothetical protein